MVHYRPLHLFSLFFNPFSFILFWQSSLKIPVFCFIRSFFCLILSAVDIFFCIFNLIHCILQYQKFYSVLFNDFYLFIKHPISFLCCFSDFIDYFSMLSSISLSFFKIAISNSLFCKWIWDQLPEDYCNPLLVSSFLGFLCSLMFCTAVLY